MSIFDLFRKKKTTIQTQSDSAENMNTNTAPKPKPQHVVIQGHLYSVCEECGTPIDAYGRITHACNLLGKRLCPSCFEQLQKTTTVVCKGCSKTIPYVEAMHQLCVNCWIEHLTKLREFYGSYHTRLSDALNEMGISVSPVSTEYVDASARAIFPVVPSSTDCIPLRKDNYGYYGGDECAVFTIKVRDAVFALPDDGISIRYLKASTDKSFMDYAYSLGRGHILALASDGNDLFILNDTGSVLSTKQGWETYQLFDIIEETRRITCHYFNESEVSAAVSKYERGIEESITDKITYDCVQDTFIEYYDYGNSHEGIERVYSEMSRQNVLQHLTKYHFNLREMVFSAQKGTIPLLSIVEQLTVHDDSITIHVPESESVY